MDPFKWACWRLYTSAIAADARASESQEVWRFAAAAVAAAASRRAFLRLHCCQTLPVCCAAAFLIEQDALRRRRRALRYGVAPVRGTALMQREHQPKSSPA